jgi:hypothetical protein
VSRGPVIAITVVVVVAVALVALTLRPRDVPTYAPTPPAPHDVGRALVGPTVYTVDATSGERWRRFSFRLGAVVDDPSATDWDLAFRRYQIIANGGPGYAGRAGIRDLGPVSFASVQTVPANGYQETQGGRDGPDPRNPAIAGWYTYGFFSHVLDPKPHVWALRTADGRYAKLEILGYYCPGAQPGCLTFRYVFQGDGSPSVGAETALR